MSGLDDPYHDQHMADAFDVPVFRELSTTSKFPVDEPITEPATATIDLPSLPRIDNINVFGEISEPHIALELPRLEDLKLEPLSSSDDVDDVDDTEVDSSSELFSLPDKPIDQQPAGEDVWQLTQNLPPLSTEPQLLSWDSFFNPKSGPPRRPKPNRLSEAGPAAFDASLLRRSRATPTATAGTPLQSNALLRSLWQMGLGRQSVLFPYDSHKGRFAQAIEEGRSTGISLDCSQDVINSFVAIGNTTRRLKSFIEAAFATNGILAAVVSLAHATDVVLSAIEAHTTNVYSLLKSILQVQQLFQPVGRVLQALEQMADLAEQCSTKERFLDSVYKAVEASEFWDEAFRRVLERVLARSASDWLTEITSQVGLRNPALKSQSGDLWNRDSHAMAPDFMSEEDRRLVSDTEACLEYVKSQHPQHVLLDNVELHSGDIALTWEFDWSDIDRLEQKAQAYERNVISAIRRQRDSRVEETCAPVDAVVHSDDAKYTFESFEQEMVAFDEIKGPMLDRTPRTTAELMPDELYEAVLAFLSDDQSHQPSTYTIRPPLSLTPSMSMRSLLRTQNHLLSYTTAHSLLHEQGLMKHLELHHVFSLFASGLFTARLQHVLFSTETEAAERQSGVLRTGGSSRGGGMGLKLGTGERTTWPPASSELRLALMGVLGESWREEKHLDQSSSDSPSATLKGLSSTDDHHTNALEATGDSNLPGSLSFAIRTDLSDSSIERILNADSVAALDFLRLTYTPTSALEHLFSTRTLELYDRIFGLWLRFTRATSTLHIIFGLCRRLQRTTQHQQETARIQRFRFEIHFFITTVTSHFRLAGIESPWTALQAQLSQLAASCADPCPFQLSQHSETASATVPSLANIKQLHDRTLGAITANLLLRKKQTKAYDALEGACETVLRFAKLARRRVEAEDTEDDEADPETSVEELQTQFKAHVDDFNGACHAFVDVEERKSRRVGAAADDDDGVRCTKDLLAVLDGYEQPKQRAYD